MTKLYRVKGQDGRIVVIRPKQIYYVVQLSFFYEQSRLRDSHLKIYSQSYTKCIGNFGELNGVHIFQSITLELDFLQFSMLPYHNFLQFLIIFLIYYFYNLSYMLGSWLSFFSVSLFIIVFSTLLNLKTCLTISSLLSSPI